jgi:hypothetical protein
MNDAVEDFHIQIRQAVFDRMSVIYLVSDRVESDPGWPVAAEGLRQGRHFVIQRNPAPLPRAYVVPIVNLLPDGDPSTVLNAFRITDPQTSVAMREDPLRALPRGPRQAFRVAAWLSTDPNHPRFQVTTEAPGLLVVTDSWVPGWTAEVDGIPTPVLRGNGAQRVVALKRPGHHTIVLHYQPPGFALGFAITAVTGVAWLLLSLISIWPRKGDSTRKCVSAGAGREFAPFGRNARATHAIPG